MLRRARSTDHAAPRRKLRLGRWLLLWLPLLFVAITTLQVLSLRWIPPPTSMFMLNRRIDGMFDRSQRVAVRYQWRSLSRISLWMPVSVIASEDQKFFDHHGFDMQAIDKAMDNNQRGRRVRGASTISQQVAKNLFLWSGRNYLRKGLEAWYTVLIEALWPKRRIVEVYVNVAEFGDGIYGAEAAAQAYFHKSAAQLNASESARLAAVLPSPRRWSVVKPGPFVQRHANWIERQVRQLGGLAWYRESIR